MESNNPTPSDFERVVFVHAHPDDETIVTGGTIATLVDRGAIVTVVTCTRGELGEVIPPELAHLEGDGAALATERMTELANALAILGVTDHRFLGDVGARREGLAPRRYTDSGMQWGDDGAEPTEHLSADAFCAAQFGEPAADLAGVMLELRPNAVISYDAHGGYGHPDHIRAHEIARRAAEVLDIPFFEIVTDPGAPADVEVDVRAVVSRTREALRAHRTQVAVDGDRFSLSSGPSRPIASVERFARTDNSVARMPDPVGWKDQTIGVHAFGWVLAFVVGVLIGGICVVDHQYGPGVLGTGLSVGVIISLVIIAALLSSARILFPGRSIAAIATVGVLGTIGLFTTESAGGSVLIPANLAGYVLTYGSLLIAFVTLIWPKARTASRDKVAARAEPKGTIQL